MKQSFSPALLSALLFVLLSSLASGAPEAQWKEVDDAVSKGLPKTAIEKLAPIAEAAVKDKAYPEAIKAIARRIALEGEIQGGKAEEKITRLEAEIAKAPKEMVPVLNAILADWYWHYFQQNRYRFIRRSTTAEAPGNDITSWDLPRMLAEIDKQFTKALSASAELKSIPIASYDALLEKGTVPDSYRPTLFDFIAHEALAFYMSGEQAGNKAEDSFDLQAESPIFAPASDFIKWEPASTDTESLTLRAVRLFQDLLRFHAEDADKSAFLHAELSRLEFGHNKAFGEQKDARYKTALERFVGECANHEISAWARYDLASLLEQEGNPASAHETAKLAVGAFPESIGGKLCYNLIQQIEAKSARVETERIWNAPWPDISVHYRNIGEIHFRAVRVDYSKELATHRGRPESIQFDQREELLRRKPEREWPVKLPPTPDFRERLEQVPAPKDLPPGFYLLIASPDAGFGANNNVVTVTDFWVSNLALIIRNRIGEPQVEGFVLDALSGEPIEGAEVAIWSSEGEHYNEKHKTKTDRNGLFAAPIPAGHSVFAFVNYKDQQLAAASDIYTQQASGPTDVSTQTVFFTDRSLYRPGQTIQYKGICLRADRTKDNYKALGGQEITVLLNDANGKEIAKQAHRTNDYGSFAGSFTAPRDRLAGSMMLRVDHGPLGNAVFNVEEYKRPKFQVSIDPPKGPAKLNAQVGVEGKATGYSGEAIGDAKVRYRVVRQVRFPAWWGMRFWWRPIPSQGGQEIAHGIAVTKPDGSFAINFLARPDPAVSEKDEPTFQYSVFADVTDTTGETRSAQRSVNIGFASIQATLSADEWLTVDKPVEIRATTQSLDGEGSHADGTVKIWSLKQPVKVVRPNLPGYSGFSSELDGAGRGLNPNVHSDPSNPDSWEQAEMIVERPFATDGAGKSNLEFKLPAGLYRATLETKDGFGKKVTAQLSLRVLAPDAKALPIKIPNLVAAPKWTVEPGEEYMALWGTGYDQGRAFIEIEHRHKILQSFWTAQGSTQAAVKQAVTESMRGGFTLHVTMVRENRAYLTSHKVDVPWSNKKLTIKWEHFVSKLEPARKETWTAVITGPDSHKAAAEMVAALYDQSLDAYLPHRWLEGFGVFHEDSSNRSSVFENIEKQLQYLVGNAPVDQKQVAITYRRFPDSITANFGQIYYREDLRRLGGAVKSPAPMAMADRAGFEMHTAAAAQDLGLQQNGAAQDGADKAGAGAGEPPPPAQLAVDLGKVSARKNLNETAFFFPQLLSREDGSVSLEFTMPEALTTWRFMGFAHDADLRSGYIEDKVVTSKDLMVQPNPPRFLREGDGLEFTVKVSNQSAGGQHGTVRLSLFDARTSKPLDAQFGIAAPDQSFDLPAGESHSFSWKLLVPEGAEPITYKAVAASERVSDGEEGLLPVLTNRTLVTESLPLPIRGPAAKQFTFTKLLESGNSPTLKSQCLTVQMVSNPSLYAVMALPYLMEFPHECSEQTFNRLYANSLARHIAASDPKIRAVFDQWKATPALDSPLAKNQDLKSVLIDETPWVAQQQAESQARRNVGVLFDDNRLTEETARLLRKLSEQQMADGAWPWFPGGPANDYITLYITTGFGRLRHLGVKIDTAAATKSLQRLDGWIDKLYRDIPKGREKDDHLSPVIAFYLYGRSFFIAETPIGPAHREAVDYFLDQARKYWLKLDRQPQGHLAIALKRFGDKPAAEGIMRSIQEHSVTNEEMGMFWRDAELSWWWYRAPIETQALMIEAFDEVMNDAKSVEECKVWLLKQKQTQDWKTTKATADAVYALLLRGENLLASDELVEVSLGGVPVKPEHAEPGTGFYEERFTRGEIKPEQGRITVKKSDKGVAWGSVHWQYLEDLSKVSAYEGTPLKLTKTLYTRQFTKKGPVLEEVKGAVKVGDELVVRIVLHTDRDMEYVHLKDHRGSGTEPVNVLSQYKFQDGLAYYESTRDTASHFFIDYLPKGNYVFEYATHVVHKGHYQTGFASIQCMYAPEFNSHSQSIWLEAQ